MEFYMLLFALFVIPPEKRRYWVFYVPIQFLVLSICCMEHILALYFFSGNFEKVAEISHLMKAISAYIWMIVLFNGTHLKDLLRYNYRYQDRKELRVIGTTQKLGKLLFALSILLLLSFLLSFYFLVFCLL
jgi:hypothetical protein